MYELDKRLPDNLEFFQKLQLFSPKQCLNQLHPSFIELPFIDQFLNKSMFGTIETQWEKLTTVKFTSYLSEDELSDSLKFWSKLYSFKDSGSTYIFRELSEFVLKLLCLPSSNAIVERVFSILNGVKTRSRNKINLVMLTNLLRIRCHFNSLKKCCTSFVPTKSMYTKFNSTIMYKSSETVTSKSNNLACINDDDDYDDLLNVLNEVSFSL